MSLSHMKSYLPSGVYLAKWLYRAIFTPWGLYNLWPYRAIFTPGGYIISPLGGIYPDALDFLSSRHQMALYFLSTPVIRTNSIPGTIST